MSAKDKFHHLVRVALESEGWTVTDDPLSISFGGVDVYIDLAAEKLILAEREEEKIAVEIKSFLGSSAISDFHLAVGQFINYRTILNQKDPKRSLYLAIPEEAYDNFFRLEFTQTVIKNNQINLIVYNVEKEVIVQWQN
ncbi:MAG: XisH family protein [Crocosphaera sp.]|nr:XisH family protein [Crocosphaera sp.]